VPISKTIVALLLLLAASTAACAREPRVVLRAAGGDVPVTVEVADTDATRTVGLMYRRELGENAGMLFIFETTMPLSFWMKNTVLPLDMIFIGEDRKIVGIVKNAVPFTTTSRKVDGASRYVLEVNAGFSDKHGVKAGDTVTFEDVPGLAAAPG
jgi:hypothetical protein